MTRLLSRLFVAVLLGSPALYAVRPAPAAPAVPATPAPTAAPTTPPPPYELKKRSVFTAVNPDARAPFWPIGWVKRQASATTQAAPVLPKVMLDEKSFKVTSILIGSGTTPSLAVINGRAYSEGEYLRMPKGGTPPARVRVQRINDGNVTLQNGDQTLVATLYRPELSSPKPEELILDRDR